ncbi:putative pyoverdine/dityrosine biosynthesis protein [Aspergillus avenaceus]|uniref:Putative pyoverdine/dityrosine biosynthesis protein n=1 Tax=Aspergillus avenaceus TaxID=36643 RepID=A0A5N6TU92_ASPAV|nr:putative pyoverdine/dityrosine biosynthesis protein [Aspergillus avenaceus]
MPSIAQVDYEGQPSGVKTCNEIKDQAFSKACEILQIITRYRSIQSKTFEDLSHEGEAKFLSIIYDHIKKHNPIPLVLPAFPFKSPNRLSKTLGSLPDKGEEVSLFHLNGLCEAIGDVYAEGARLIIASDGIVYNDLLGVPDYEVWQYGQSLREMARINNCKRIEFVRLWDFLGPSNGTALNQEAYELKAPLLRDALIERYTPKDLDVNLKIASDDDTCATYRGYIKFLTKDLAHTHVSPEVSKSQHKKHLERIAKAMIGRGVAFAGAVAKHFPDHVRLSIHPSNGSRKISISVLPETSALMTPWHSATLITLDGQMHFEHRDKLDAREDVELVWKGGRPWYYRTKSELYSWSIDVQFEPVYPCGIIVQPASDGSKPSLADVDMQKMRGLAQENSPITLRGFSNTRDREAFVAKAEEMGEPVGWKFGLILEVKDQGLDSRGLNNVLSSEWMPWHYDGLFKIKKEVDPDGNERTVSLPPKFQFFTAISPSPPDTGYTLFAPSRLIFRYLPADVSLESLKNLTWNVRTSSFDSAVIQKLPLVVPHFATGKPCLRYHEPWPQEKTRFDPTYVTIDQVEDSEGLCKTINSLLHDRRIAYWHSWEEGDCLFSDNVNMMHTRSSFTGQSDRCLWRIHVD